jgi:hypothetical protein
LTQSCAPLLRAGCQAGEYQTPYDEQGFHKIGYKGTHPSLMVGGIILSFFFKEFNSGDFTSSGAPITVKLTLKKRSSIDMQAKVLLQTIKNLIPGFVSFPGHHRTIFFCQNLPFSVPQNGGIII